MGDERLEDMRKTMSEAEIERTVASPQQGSQPWMNRPVGLTVEQYKTYADEQKAKYTADEIKYLSSMAAVAEFRADPVVFLQKHSKVDEAKVTEAVIKYLKEHP